MGSKDDYLDLLTLLSAVKEAVAESFPVPVWVKAEISSWNPKANGHCYLTLSQNRGGKIIAETRAMIWSWKYLMIKEYFESSTGERLRDGLTVLVQVKVNYSELYGVSLYVEGIDPSFTLGEKAQERKRIIARLESGGYMDLQKELVLPELPRRLAVITSRTAAGYQDFQKHLQSSGYAISFDLFEALMQGEQAPSSICEALEEAAEGGYDAILILRGGGSETDLACFDDESLAMAIATCPVPVVTAIGHDKDVHIADMVSGQSVKTPTALADLFLNAFRAQDDILDDMEARIAGAARQIVARQELLLSGLDAKLHRAVQGRLALMEQSLQRVLSRISKGLILKYSDLAARRDAVVHRLRFAAAARVSQEVSALALREARIKSTDPRNILSMGYVLVTGRDNKVLKTVRRVAVGDRIGVRFSDGSLTAKVDEIYREDIDNNKINIA